MSLMAQTSSTIEELNSRLGIAGRAQVLADEAGIPKVCISTPRCNGEMHLHGAQVTSWEPAGAEEVIFLSRQARWEEGKAVRGGIPICFPWFRAKADDSHAPAHGVVRTKVWMLESIEQNAGGITVSMSTQSDPDTRRWWPADFRVLNRVTFGSELKLELTVSNTGAKPFRFEEALHTYYRVGDVRRVRVRGLDGVTFLDNTDSNKKKKQNGDVVISSPTDNAYMNSQNPLQLIDPVLNRSIQVTKQNSDSIVIWNPWAEGARALSDLGDDEWHDMVCVEGSNILGNAVELAPSANHKITVAMTLNSV
jgi:glucose-6-phosphate 1-epimerase